MVEFYNPNGSPISSWSEWTRPKKDYQWKAGRSAMELARSWFRNDTAEPPQELVELFESIHRTKGLVFVSGIPELVTVLPERGEGRNHDLALIGRTASESVTICIEAKADEPFGNHTVAEYWRTALGRREKGISTRVPERIQSLLHIVDPDRAIEDSTWKGIRYQLLTAICGTILQTKIEKSDFGLLIVHEFKSNETAEEKHKANHSELEQLLQVLSGKILPLTSGQLYGAFNIDGVDLFLGKIVTSI